MAIRLQPSDFEARPLSIGDFFKTIATLKMALPCLETYINNSELPEVKSWRESFVRDKVEEAIREHKITKGDRRYPLIYDFYMRVFGVEAPYYGQIV